jgi:hypothetical protein
MKRLLKILKWIGIVTGAAIAILLMINAYFVWSTGIRLERRLADLRQAGDPVQLADLAREPIPPEQDADVFLRRAADDLDAIQKELLAQYPKTGQPPGALPPADQDKLEKLFAAYPRVMPLLEQAARCPDYDPQLDGSLPPTRFLESWMGRTSRRRLLTRVMRARTALLLSRGRSDEALATQVLMLRLTRLWRGEPLLMGYLVTTACEQAAMDGVNEVLQAGPVSPAARQALDAELALQDSMEGYKGALRSERAFSLSSVREMPGAGSWLTRGFVNILMLRLIDLFDRYLENASRPYAVVVSEKGEAAAPSGGPNPYGALVKLLEPPLASTREVAERVRAMSRSLRVLNALQTRVPVGSDRVPKLTDLGLPGEATIDPFNGELLHVKKLPEGWLVYSVGSNLIDEGGQLDQKADLGAGPVGREASARQPQASLVPPSRGSALDRLETESPLFGIGLDEPRKHFPFTGELLLRGHGQGRERGDGQDRRGLRARALPGTGHEAVDQERRQDLEVAGGDTRPMLVRDDPRAVRVGEDHVIESREEASGRGRVLRRSGRLRQVE